MSTSSCGSRGRVPLKLHACASSRLAACCFMPRGPEPGSVVKRCQVSSTGALTSSLSSYIELHV